MVYRYKPKDIREIFNEGVKDKQLHFTYRKQQTMRTNGLLVPSIQVEPFSEYNPIDLMLFAYIRQSQIEGFSTQSRHKFVPKVREHLEEELGNDPEWEDCRDIGFICSKDHSEIHMVKGKVYHNLVSKSDTCYHSLASFVNMMYKLEKKKVEQPESKYEKEEEQKKETVKVFFTPKDVRKMVDISYRQIQYWDKTNFIKPSYRRKGKYKLFTKLDIFKLKIAYRLRAEHDYSIQRLRAVIRDVTNIFYNINKYDDCIAMLRGNSFFVIPKGVITFDPDAKKPFTESFSELVKQIKEKFPLTEASSFE